MGIVERLWKAIRPSSRYQTPVSAPSKSPLHRYRSGAVVNVNTGATQADPRIVGGMIDGYGEAEEYADGGGGFIRDRGQYERAKWQNVSQYHIRMGDGLENLPPEDDHQDFRDWLSRQ